MSTGMQESMSDEINDQLQLVFMITCRPLVGEKKVTEENLDFRPIT